MKTWLIALTVAASLGAADLDSVKREPDLEKRCERALEVAAETMAHARTLPGSGGSMSELQKDLDATVAAVELSLQSLRDTGKRPYKLARAYKRGEIRTRDLDKEIEGLIQAIGFENRAAVEKARDKLVVLHEEYLLGVMSGK